MSNPLVSVVISCLNGTKWLPNCFASLRKQTIFDKIEVILVDDFSTDGTAELGRRELAEFPRAKVIRNPQALGYAGGNNVGAEAATGEWVLILNDDTQLEPDCLEQLIHALETAKADVAVPAPAEYSSMKIVPSAPAGFDIFGRASWAEDDHTRYSKQELSHSCFFIGGAAFLIRRAVWQKVGGFDATHFMYAEDDDISWKVWLAGYQGIYVHNAILHHRDSRGWEIKEFTRYLVNRNGLLVIAKNAQNILLLCGMLQILMLLGEGLLLLLVTRRGKFVWNSYCKAIIDAFKMWPHILEQRRFIRQIRRRSDWTMARMFLRFRINRWDMVKAFFLKGQRPVMK
jgi:GT2 family glycosyltransferase